MVHYSSSYINKITEDCINLYQNIPKNGKPIENEWTVLSCVIEVDKISKNNKIVALGTGSKCIGATKMSPLGNILNDSHAEVIARRGFLLYLYKNILDTINEKSSIFIRENEKFKLKDNIEYLFYSSQMPCGDASIIPKSGEQDDYGDLIINNKRAANIDICEIESKKVKTDIHRTGAKCLTHSNQDPKEPGDKYHLIGQVRTKPGRGDRTLSVSCSDKIARWIHLGIQGALLSLILHEPIYIKCFIFGSRTPFSKDTLHRALIYRDNEDVLERIQIIPEFHNSSIVFPHIRTANSIRPAAGSIIYVNINNGEGSVGGLERWTVDRSNYIVVRINLQYKAPRRRSHLDMSRTDPEPTGLRKPLTRLKD
ncbi:unnamed protein product [Danaus chrysippus]|uniref:tRNA-specific adenosine deaminase 1 n=1 Tax=Danaus chrysippus TaxID=151541 RepID=A0A8J2VQ44_9NEOP|nr:unnamed protein product [Danaus chrysippus]